MPKPKRPYIRKPYNFSGKILHHEQKTINSGEFKGNFCYKLTILTKQQTKQFIYVFANLVSEELWKTIQQEKFLTKHYYFTCQKGKNADFRLLKMEEYA